MVRELIRETARRAAILQNVDVDAWLDLVTDDFVFRTIGTTAASGSWEGKKGARELESMVAGVLDDDGLTLMVDDVIVEGDVAVVIGRGRSRTRVAQEPYNNTYCLVLRFRGDKISEWTEYLDTALVEHVLEVEARIRPEG
jgi:ketosteroid isomerase-like protein